ncbi:MAG: DnaJ C-terminal domain-containing protein [Alphaproteobacteria bacterium]
MPQKTLYDILGIPKTSSISEIKKAYRTLARKLHPDVNPNDKSAEDKFKEVTRAYDILSDEKTKQRYDNGEIDEMGQEKVKGFNWKNQNYSNNRSYNKKYQNEDFSDFFNNSSKDDFDFFDIFKSSSANKKKTSTRTPKSKGADIRYSLKISFIESAQGANKRISLTSGKKLDINIPAGTHNGQMLRLKEQGMPGFGGLKAGDALIEILVEEHSFFEMKGLNILLEVPVTIKEAELGAKITVPTISGKVAVSIPPKSNTDTVLRIKGKGITYGEKTGDQLVKLKVVLPDGRDPAFEKFVQEWKPVNNKDPRASAGII